MTSMSIFQISGSALTAQSQRMNVAASNMANAHSAAGPEGTPYRPRQVVFQMAPAPGRYQAGSVGGVNVVAVRENIAPARMVYEPSSPLANKEGYVAMPNVDVVAETVNMISASRAYQANIEVINTAKSLMMRTLSIGQ